MNLELSLKVGSLIVSCDSFSTRILNTRDHTKGPAPEHLHQQMSSLLHTLTGGGLHRLIREIIITPHEETP